MTNLEQALVAPEMTISEQMESQMSVGWSGLNKFFNELTRSGKSDTRGAWKDTWVKNKSSIFKAWGNKVRIEKEVELSLSDKDVAKEIQRFIEILASLDNISPQTLYKTSVLLGCLPISDILQNKLSEKLVVFGNTLGKGMKVSKAMGRLVSDNKERDLLQTEFSMITQGFKAQGTLVMSIDPIDILTMSYSPDNAWRSCHNIVNGEFRGGAISYVLDECSFISYVYSSKGTCSISGLELPNKSWRVMGYLNSGFIALSSHYPATNKNNRATLVESMKDIYGDKVSGGMLDSDLPKFNSMFQNNGRLHYNDITEGRATRFYMVDLEGKVKKEDSDTFLSAMEKLDSSLFPVFEVGLESVPGFDNEGYIEDSEYISCQYYDQDDDDCYDDDDDDEFYD